ncbi:MAG TPA: S8 family serine peptidase [Vicinamibacterales bacterium]|jgi:serine protease AprX|nr:S8 family serine peptidase [Vicinamibacterales bacterium]
MRKTPNSGRFFALLLLLAATGPTTLPMAATDPPGLQKLDKPLRGKAAQALGRSRVIVRGANGVSSDELDSVIRGAGGGLKRSLRLVGGRVAELPDAALPALASNPLVGQVSEDRHIVGAMERTSATVGATTVRRDLGYDGSGIGVAVIDSGASATHDDLFGANGTPLIERFVDFVNGQEFPYDDYGHGTHVSGIVAGSGFDSGGARAGIAPGVRLTVLKVLDSRGDGYISDVIAAFDYVIEHKDELNIRVVNLSVATGVYESYTTDPLTVGAEAVVRSGVVVVAAAGNNGRGPNGRIRRSGVTAPGNAPSVLTVGASSHMGTIDRDDDTMASFSSRGPSAIDYGAKPDLVAPGIGIESLSEFGSRLYSTRSKYLLPGTVATSYLPYLSLSGTSMSAPVVTGTVALMLQANPSLTPNAVKAILQYTAERHGGYDPLTEGAGFLNALGAVQLAQYLASPSSDNYPDTTSWSRTLIWGNQMVRGGRLTADANAWASDVAWGSNATPGGQSIEWGVVCGDESCTTTSLWRLEETFAVNVVWGPTCGGADCQMPWTGSVYGTSDEGDTVVWGTTDEDTVVWGTTDEDTVVWGTGDGEDTVVWGTSCSDPDCEPVIWRVQ